MQKMHVKRILNDGEKYAFALIFAYLNLLYLY
jgi:hypothetical protein